MRVVLHIGLPKFLDLLPLMNNNLYQQRQNLKKHNVLVADGHMHNAGETAASHRYRTTYFQIIGHKF